MLFHTSNKIFIHVDCDSFFANCEVLKNPSLKGKYVCVWHEIIIASTYNCKKLWVKTWTPIWEARKILWNKGVFLWLDHEFYSDVSDKLFKYLSEKTLSLEPFSIDEAFCEITWLPEYFWVSIEKYVKNLQKEILETIWIPVSIWVANTHIKSKIFSKINKPFWIYIWLLKDKEIELFKKMKVSYIPFIWRKLTYRIEDKSPTIYDFMKLWFWEIKKEIGKNWTDLWLELMWVNAFIVRKSKEAKSISRSRSFNKHMTTDKDFLWNQALIHFNRLFEDITSKNIEIKHISLFFRDKEFRVFNYEKKFQEHTNERNILLSYLKELFENNYSNILLCRSVWIVFSDFRSYLPRQMSIFDKPIKWKDNNYELSKVISKLNEKYHSRKITFWTSLLWNNEKAKLWFRK